MPLDTSFEVYLNIKGKGYSDMTKMVNAWGNYNMKENDWSADEYKNDESK